MQFEEARIDPKVGREHLDYPALYLDSLCKRGEHEPELDISSLLLASIGRY